MKKKKLFLISLGIISLIYFFVKNPEKTEENTITIFVHIPKTAGEGFKRNIEASYSLNQFIRTSFTYCEPYYDILQKTMKFYEGIDHFKTNIALLSEEERNKIRCIGGHDSYFGIHELFTQKPKYITFIRDPVDRTISLYNFERMAYEIYVKKPSLNQFEKSFLNRLENYFLIDGQIPDFETWLEKTYDQKHPFYLSMTKYLQNLGFSTNSLDQFAFVGITESYEEDSLFMYHELQVNRFYADKNKSTNFVVKQQLDDRVLEMIIEKNREDFQLYQLAVEKNQAFKKEKKDFSRIVSSMTRKKKLFFILEPAMCLMERAIRKCRSLTRFQNPAPARTTCTKSYFYPNKRKPGPSEELAKLPFLRKTALLSHFAAPPPSPNHQKLSLLSGRARPLKAAGKLSQNHRFFTGRGVLRAASYVKILSTSVEF